MPDFLSSPLSLLFSLSLLLLLLVFSNATLQAVNIHITTSVTGVS